MNTDQNSRRILSVNWSIYQRDVSVDCCFIISLAFYYVLYLNMLIDLKAKALIEM